MTVAVVASSTLVTGVIGPAPAFAIEGEVGIGAPTGSGCFGDTVFALSTGNIVIADPCFDLPGIGDVGAVYLYDGETREQLTRLHGTTAGDAVGTAVVPLTNGNLVVASPLWGSADVGAVTWVNGETGLDGPVAPSNSLTGTMASDHVGSRRSGLSVTPRTPSIAPLANGNYVVASPDWDNGSMLNAGAITWGDGDTGVAGQVSTANSLYGSLTFLFAGVDDSRIGSGGVTALTNGNYVVASPSFSYVEQTATLPILRLSVGAATWADGSAPTVGAVTRSNSVYGTAAGDGVSGGGVTALANGHYVVGSPGWSGLVAGGGAATWGNGATGSTGAVATGNSLYGTTASVGVGGLLDVAALSNGNYVVTTSGWPNGAASNAGAATFVNGGGPNSAGVSAANSLVGTQAGDGIGIGALALTNGNFVVAAPSWDKPGSPNAGAVTWVDGTAGRVGVISAATSLTGAAAEDSIGASVGALSNGNYVIASQLFGTDDGGAVTWADGSTGTVGTVGPSNSIIGGAGDNIGAGIVALSDGNYAFTSPSWDGGRCRRAQRPNSRSRAVPDARRRHDRNAQCHCHRPDRPRLRHAVPLRFAQAQRVQPQPRPAERPSPTWSSPNSAPAARCASSTSPRPIWSSISTAGTRPSACSVPPTRRACSKPAPPGIHRRRTVHRHRADRRRIDPHAPDRRARRHPDRCHHRQPEHHGHPTRRPRLRHRVRVRRRPP